MSLISRIRPDHGAPPDKRLHLGRRSALAAATSVTLAVGLIGPSQLVQAASNANNHGKGVDVIAKHAVQQGPIDRLSPKVAAAMKASHLRKPVGVVTASSVKLPGGKPVDPIELRVLVLATNGDPNPNGVNTVPPGSWDWNLSTVTTAMSYAGVPYDTYLASTKQLCIGGSWRIDWTTSSTAASCTSGKTADWSATGLTADKLWDGGVHAYYEGVIQTNGTLSYLTPDGTWVGSGLSTPEWTALWGFEAQFNIRSASLETYPTADFGLIYKSEDGNPTTATWTTAGKTAFPYVNPNGSLPINGAYTYRASTDPTDTTTSVLLTDAAGDALGVIHTVTNQGNRQVMALTMDSAGYLLHGEVLGYGVVSWVTKGLFLGARKAYLSPEPDDLYIADNVWTPTTPCSTRTDDPSLPIYRLTGADFNAVTNWQTTRQKPAISKAFRIEFPYNAEGTTPDGLAVFGLTTAQDTLTPAVKKNAPKFAFVNHTWSHQNMDSGRYDVTASTTTDSTGTSVTTLSAPPPTFKTAWGWTVIADGVPAGTIVNNVSIDGGTVTLSNPTTIPDGPTNVWMGVTYDEASGEISKNAAAAKSLGLVNLTPNSMIQPDISGLNSPNFLQAAYDNGMRYLISDTSRTGDPNRYGDNEGTWSTGTYDQTQTGGSASAGTSWSLLEVARYPNNLYFNVKDPASWLAEDNCLHPSGSYGYVTSYADLLDRESTTLVRYLLQGHNRPLMFHQANVAAYDGKNSTLGDLMDATLNKYAQLVTAPVQSLPLNQLGVLQSQRMDYNKALSQGQLTASIVPGTSITVTNNSSLQVKVPVTGLNAGAAYGAEKYAGQNISYLTLSAGQSVTLPLK